MSDGEYRPAIEPSKRPKIIASVLLIISLPFAVYTAWKAWVIPTHEKPLLAWLTAIKLTMGVALIGITLVSQAFDWRRWWKATRWRRPGRWC